MPEPRNRCAERECAETDRGLPDHRAFAVTGQFEGPMVGGVAERADAEQRHSHEHEEPALGMRAAGELEDRLPHRP